MPHFILAIQQPDGGPLPPEDLEPIMEGVRAFNRELREAGAWVFAGGLTDASEAVVARTRDGQVVTTDGPYVEGKEHVGGLSVITAPDLDAAVEWGRKLARVLTIPVEIREFQGLHGDHLP